MKNVLKVSVGVEPEIPSCLDSAPSLAVLFKCAGKSKIDGTAFCFNFRFFKVADRGRVQG